MEGVNPYAYMQLLAGQIDSMSNRAVVESALDDLEYLFEVTGPGKRDIARDFIDLIVRLNDKLKAFDAKP